MKMDEQQRLFKSAGIDLRARKREIARQREYLHFQLGWPWSEIPSVNLTIEKEFELLLTEPYVHPRHRKG